METPVIARSQDMNDTVRLWAVSGPRAGECVERAPIDARDMLKWPEVWSLTPPGAEPVVDDAPAEVPVVLPANVVTHAFDAPPAAPTVLPRGRTARKG